MTPEAFIAKWSESTTKKHEPAILRHEDHEPWLNGTPDDAFACLKQYPDDLLIAYRVSTRVNSPRNNDAELVRVVG